MHWRESANGMKLSMSARRRKLQEIASEGIWLYVAQASCSGAAVFALQPCTEWVNHLGRPVYTADCIEQSVIHDCQWCQQ